MQGGGDQPEWYLSRNGQQHGPISGAELGQLVQQRRIAPSDLVWRTGWPDWYLARDVPGLIPPPPQAAAPPPLPARQTVPQATASQTLAGNAAPDVRQGPDARGSQPAPRENDGTAQSEQAHVPTTMTLVAYILLLIPAPPLPLIGFIIALVNMGTRPEWLGSHYRWQVRTTLIGLLYVVIGVATSLFVVGYFILLFTLVWLIVRYVKGISALNRGEAVAKLKTWLW